MLQRLPIALAQVKAGNNSENLLNEVRQIVYSLYQSKEVNKKVYNNSAIMKIDTIFINSENSKTSEPYTLTPKLTDKLDLRRGEKNIALLNLSIYYTWKNIDSSCNTTISKYQLQHGMINLNYQMDRILYQIVKIILSILYKNMENKNICK